MLYKLSSTHFITFFLLGTPFHSLYKISSTHFISFLEHLSTGCTVQDKLCALHNLGTPFHRSYKISSTYHNLVGTPFHIFYKRSSTYNILITFLEHHSRL